MSKSKDSALKFFPSKNVRPLSGVLAARTVTIPPKQRNEFTLSSQVQNTKTETSSKAEQDVSDAALNDRLIEDSEFLLRATLFLQTAEEQLSSIESSLKRPMYLRNLLGLNLENCEDKKYAKEIVGAILSGHNLKREDFFSIPTRLQRQSVSDKPLEALKENSLKPESKLSSINRKKVRQSSENKVASSQKELHKFLRISGQENLSRHRTTDKVSQTSSSTEINFPSQSTIPEDSRSEASEKSQLIDKPRKSKEYFISGEAKHEYPMPYQVTRKKMTIEDVPICVTTDLKTPNNAALINILSNTTEPEDDNPTKSKLAKNSLKIQAMPSINIKPALIQETFTQVDIQPCKSLQKEFATNKNVSFIEMVHDENSKIIRKGTPFSGNTYMDGLNRKPNLNAERLVPFRETNLEHVPRQECVPKQEPLLVKKHKIFRRERLDQILNTITDKLTAQIEIPDEILENAIDRLWVLGDYLEDMYTNSAGNFHQKVRLNFTSLWLHEIVRLIDIEMKRKPDSLNTGIPTIVQYIISEIQCESAINYQQSCIIAEENDEIRFYCEHDSPLNLQYKHKLGNQSVSFRTSSRNSPQTNNRPLINSLASKAKEHPESKKSHNFLLKDFQEPNKADSEHVGANLIPPILSSSRSKLTSKTVHGLSSKRNLENCIKVGSQDHSVPEKLVTSKIKNTDGKETTSKNNLSFHEKNKFMNADQRQKVIQKLGAEVKKMLSWHEQIQPRKDIIRLPNHSVSRNACISASVTTPPKTAPPVTIPPLILPSKDEIHNVESCNEVIGAETNFQEMVKGIDFKVASSSSASSKSTVTDQVSPAIASGEVAYDDDWEEDSNTPSNTSGSQNSCHKRENGSSESMNFKPEKPEPVKGREDKQDKQKRNDEISEINSSNSTLHAEKSKVSKVNYDITAKSPEINSSTPEAVQLQSVKSSQKSPNYALQEGYSNNSHAIKNSVSSETDIASDFGDQEISILNTKSDNAQNYDSVGRKSCVPSEAETVKDLSQLSSEVAAPQSMSLHFQENSYKENDSGIVQQSLEYNLASRKDDLVDQGKRPEIENYEQPMNGSLASMKLSKSCQALAENVLRVEEMKNDLLRAFTKSGKGSAPIVSYARSSPDLARKPSSKWKNSRPNSAPEYESINIDMCVIKTVSVASENLPCEEVKKCENAVQSRADISERRPGKVSHTALQAKDLKQAFSDLSFEPSVNELSAPSHVKKPIEALSRHENLQMDQTCSNFSSKSSCHVSGTKLSAQTHVAHTDLAIPRPFCDLTSKSSVNISHTELVEELSKACFLQNDLECKNVFSDVSSKSNRSVYDFENVVPTPSKVSLRKKDFETNQVFSDLSSKSSVSSVVSEPGTQSSAGASSASDGVQPVFVSKTASEKRHLEVIDDKEEVSENETSSDLNIVKMKGNNIAQSFVELSNEILKHLKLESELLMQLHPFDHDSDANSSVKWSENVIPKISRTNLNSSETTSSHSELEVDQDDIVFLSSEASADFECLMSQLSENVRESVESMDELLGDSAEEILSVLSSERFRVDCSQGLDASIKDILYSDVVDPSNFVMERF